MTSKRGMSGEEKRKAVLGCLRAALRPFTLKELEKVAAKAGVVQNTVKDVVGSLADDGLVDMDKIGATNWFWSFPSKEAAARRTKIKVLKDKVAVLESEVKALEERKQELLKDRPQTAEREAKIKELETLLAQRKTLESRLAEAKANDPEEARKLQKAVNEAKAGAERWTDNTWVIMDWLKKSYGVSRKDAQRQLGITDDFDYPVFSAEAMAKGNQKNSTAIRAPMESRGAEDGGGEEGRYEE